MADDTSSSHDVLCGLCRAPVARRIEPDGKAQFGCAACDNWAERDEVLKIAKQHAVDEAQIFLNRGMADVARRSKMMTFSGKTTNDKTYRFITDLKF